MVQMISSLVMIPIALFSGRFNDDVSEPESNAIILNEISIPLKYAGFSLSIQDELETSTEKSDIDSSASKWLGIEKLSGENSIFLTFIAHLLYVGLLSITNAILHYQQRKRFLDGQQTGRPKVMFPRISRDDADKNLNASIKYLFNYVFHKFGIEVTFMAMLLLILIRADLMAVAYTIWLLVLAVLTRNGKRYIWAVFQAFIVITASIQYIVILRMPPSMNASELNPLFSILCFLLSWLEGKYSFRIIVSPRLSRSIQAIPICQRFFGSSKPCRQTSARLSCVVVCIMSIECVPYWMQSK